MDLPDPVVARIPIHYTNHLKQSLHLYQYPLQSRPLEVPPTASAAGKVIKARYKPHVRRVEIAVPVDVRPDVWNRDRAIAYGEGRAEEDREDVGLGDSGKGKGKQREGDVAEERLSEVRLRGEKVPSQGDYMVGIMRDGQFLLLCCVRNGKC
jgi:DNA-directed RNA polymerase III subunit RPC5